MSFPPETKGTFYVSETAAGKPAVYGEGKKRSTPFGTEYEAPLCTVDTFSDAHMICNALNAYRPQKETEE